MTDAESAGDVTRKMPSTEGHTPTPWEYRPHRFDDWGWIRGPMAEGDSIGPLVASARSGRYENEEALDKHRIAKTDPYGANAAFIIKAVNSHETLVKALEEIVNPLGVLADRAKAEGNRLSGEAYAICNSLSYVQKIARDALALLSQAHETAAESPSVIQERD